MEKKRYDILSIGYISLDNNIDCQNKKVIELGGAVTYSSAAAFALGHNVGVVTKLKKDSFQRLSALVIPKEDIFWKETKNEVAMQNKFFTPDKEKRECICLSKGDKFTIEDIPSVESEIFHFGGLVFGEFDDELIIELSKKGKTAVDVQGFLRHADLETGRLSFKDWETKKEIFPYIDYLKTDAAEAEILSKTDDREKAARLFFEWGAKEIVITHNSEVISFDGKEIKRCPIKARNLSGRSGRGDTTFAAYITERINNSVEDSLLFATACVSLKMENYGPIKADRKEIINYIKEFYEQK
ncbi:MAG: PfkB family carbohydrate kinase [Elusimicrobiota bacterium]|jgi:sugar/nucleoside kinase (ribokinase family)|nr:PfkB family carbohydrate kinase [Elusimicrobiota bacterium]